MVDVLLLLAAAVITLAGISIIVLIVRNGPRSRERARLQRDARAELARLSRTRQLISETDELARYTDDVNHATSETDIINLEIQRRKREM